MRVIDPGHQYALAHLDGNCEELLTFVKREGDGYPGNVGHHPGTNMQEVIRALIDRLKYLQWQIPSPFNESAVFHLRAALRDLEIRAALRHGRTLDVIVQQQYLEEYPTCRWCGHVNCCAACIAKKQEAAK